MPVIKTCITCEGRGTVGTTSDTCPTCGGSGELIDSKVLLDMADEVGNLSDAVNDVITKCDTIKEKVDEVKAVVDAL